ncbi:MAG: PAS domain S-box protein [Acidobacteria bacterium]|nr:PAS domain S-box protein [Acidobacteriota bacterium]
MFALFGGVAPLLALLAQPHRGVREKVTATTAVDIAGIAVLTGFLYSHFVVASDVSDSASRSLLLLSELQQLLVCLGMLVAMFLAVDPGWRQTYRRLAFGLSINLVTLTLGNAEIWQGFYQSASLADVMWILPCFFYPWAASTAPASASSSFDTEDDRATPSRPWVIFGGLALLPLIAYGLHRVAPAGPFDTFQDLSTAVGIVSVFPLLIGRLAVERAELRQSDAKLRLLAAAIEQADEMIFVSSRDGEVRHANSSFCQAVGYTQAEVRTLPVRNLLAPKSLPKLDEIQRVLDGETWRGTLVRCRKDGTLFRSSSVIVPLPDETGQVAHVVQVERDIAEELKIRGQLIHSERLSAVGQLVSGVANELNNPLQSILGFTELLIDAEERPEARRDLE